MMLERPKRAIVHVTRVTPKTRWIFLELETHDGLVGAGEATLAGHEVAVLEVAERILPAALGMAELDPDKLAIGFRPGSLAEAAVMSALDQALWDLSAKRRGIPLFEALGGARRETVILYANINRRTTDRSPEGFARSARDALQAGFDAFKIAPFDEIAGASPISGTMAEALDKGFARLQAVRETVGPDRDVMVDCHWRFDEGWSREVIRLAAELRLHWVECPVPETPENIAALKRLRGLANARGIRLAGCELGITLAGFEPFLAAGAYDVMMPDVKYMCGLKEMLRAGERFAECGVAISPHNPTGPICHAASLHVSAAIPVFDRLECQYDESPLFDALVGGELLERSGVSRRPNGPGLGAALDRTVLIANQDQPSVSFGPFGGAG